MFWSRRRTAPQLLRLAVAPRSSLGCPTTARQAEFLRGVGQDEIHDLAHFGYTCKTLARSPGAGRDGATAAVKYLAEGGAHGIDGLARQAAALQPDQIQPRQLDMVAERHGVGNHVAIDASEPANQSALTHPTELLHGCETAEDHTITKHHKPAQRHRIGEGDIVADMAVVADVG